MRKVGPVLLYGGAGAGVAPPASDLGLISLRGLIHSLCFNFVYC